ncbi:hypothetical protein B0T25DRAFT_445107 [Lasiosphaeria hispida]|uniref:Ilp is an apoptosis inhibitor n=1 Tax=Lasiosphaeria hispida TaxID=260671 RepID=A0AAJ0HWH2_9PEZI|nr:hypothetical protein B0T25DRAFT_445107 [Lasiosphaeria hispida]
MRQELYLSHEPTGPLPSPPGQACRDIFEWHPPFLSSIGQFLNFAQYSGPVQALAAYVNIPLPFQRTCRPILSTRSIDNLAAGATDPGQLAPVVPPNPAPTHTYTRSVVLPYIRRLVATGFDFPPVMRGFFGADWEVGMGPLHAQERRNYLLAAKSGSWLAVKQAYDEGVDAPVPFLRPLRDATEAELAEADAAWSEWLAMQDWMLGQRAPAPRCESRVPGWLREGAGEGATTEGEAATEMDT